MLFNQSSIATMYIERDESLICMNQFIKFFAAEGLVNVKRFIVSYKSPAIWVAYMRIETQHPSTPRLWYEYSAKEPFRHGYFCE